MVDFQARVFNEDDGKIIGAEITVYSDSGDKLGTIDIADAETLEEMQEQLASIDETYFTEERLQEILENISENTTINATKLNGFLSSDFAKVSQLSSYAPVSHTHSKSQITDLYDYQISASSYNVNIDSNVNIIVKVTNRATGQPVVGVTVPVLKNNSTWQSGITGVNGTFSLSYTADTWGLTTFSANTSIIQIMVAGFKLVQSNITYKLYVDESIRTCKVTAYRQNATITNGDSFNYNDFVIPEKYRPSATTFVPCFRAAPEIVNYVFTNGRVGIYNSGTTKTDWNIEFIHEWHY